MGGSYNNTSYAMGNYVDPTDAGSKEIGKYRDDFYNRMYPASCIIWQQGSLDTRFKCGDTSLMNYVYGEDNSAKIRRCSFGLIRRHVNMICGFQRKNRKSTIVQPLFNGDQLADDYNGVLKWCEARDGFPELFSEAFEGAVTTGQGLLTLDLDYGSDPVSGDFVVDNLAYCNFMTDVYYKKQDLSDCEAVWIRKWVSRAEFKNIFPRSHEMFNSDNYLGSKDGKFPLQAEMLNIDSTHLIPVDYFYYQTSRKATMIYDSASREAVEFVEEEGEPKDVLQQILAQNKFLSTYETHVPTVKLAISVGNHTFYHGPNLLNIDRYPMVPTLVYHEPDMQSPIWKFSGIVRGLRDAQWLYDMSKVIEFYILQAQLDSGWIYTVDSVVDPKAFRQYGQRFLIPLKAGHTPAEIQRLDPPPFQQSLIELSRSLAEDQSRISGVNEELLGSATDDKAGILSMLRQGAGLTTLQTIFDKLDYSQRLFGEIRLEAVIKNFSKRKVSRILGRDPAAGFFNKTAMKYSVVVEEGNYTTTQRQMELQQLLHFKSLGMNIPDSAILGAAFISNKKQLIDQIDAQNAQQQQMQQQQMQAQQQEAQIKVMESYARAKKDLAQASETESRIEENEANAEHTKQQADLDLVKEMMALESMEMDHIHKGLNLAALVKFQSNEMNSAEKMQDQLR